MIVAASPALATGKVSLQVGQAEFAGLQIEDLGLDWTPGAGAGGRVGMRAARIRGIGATGPLSAISIDCAALSISGDLLICENGRLSGALGSLGRQNTKFSARTQPGGGLKLHLDAVALAGGHAKAALRLDGTGWELDSSLSEIDIAAMQKIAAPLIEFPEGFTTAGRASGRVLATGHGENLSTANTELAITTLNFADAAGALAGEAVAGELKIELAADHSGDFVTDGRLALTGGQAYSDPVFLDFGVHRLSVDFSGLLSSDASHFVAHEFSLVHDGVVSVSGSVTLDLFGETMLQEAKLAIPDLDLADALPAYVQPYLTGTSLKDLEGLGHVHGEVDVAAGLPTRAVLTFEGVTLDSQTGSVSVNGLGGTLN